MQRIEVVDSHTGGEPTRVVLAGGPDLGSGEMSERRSLFREQFDDLRKAIVCEPRGNDVIVGALLCQPSDSRNAAGVIFFNNVGYLGMCVHGTIGVVTTLAHLGRLRAGDHQLETPVGIVTCTLHDDGRVTVANVPSYRLAKDVEVDVERHGRVCGDVAWGGNWFFLVSDHGQRIAMENVDQLTDFAWRVRRGLVRQQITGLDGAEIDHIELFGPPEASHADSKNFVLCPGKVYDRSPCGTGTSAKLACLAADNKLAPGQIWRQESIIGSVFEGTYESAGDRIVPRISGSAYLTAEATLLIDPRDPFRTGFASHSEDGR